MKRIALCIVLGCCFSTCDSTWSATIHDGGAANPSTGGGLSDLQSGIISADLIQLATGPALVTELHWSGFYTSEVLAQDDFFFAVYPIVGGRPAEPPLDLIHLGNVSRQPGPAPKEFQYSLALSTPIELPAGTDLAVTVYNNSGPGVADDWAWYTSGEGDGFAIPVGNTGAAWAQTRDYVLRLSGVVVPEPSAGALLGLGLAAFGYSSRRWKCRQRTQRRADG